ncbi:MAG: carbohydrate kinase family protein [Planctomycetaceae bacterium]|jgi:sugar/nucleoside kinase (ribokinase family)|nr:carbohydrate kinase family protein [Planctomycetaceae bacterium]
MTCLCCGILFADIACYPISHLPEEGELVTTDKIELNLGGCASNVAFDLARLGVPVTLAGGVGDDALSEFIVHAASVPGIETKFLQQFPGHCPGTAMHINVYDQDRRFICTTGANDLFVFNDDLLRYVKESQSSARKILYLGGFFMLRGLENERTVEFLDTARKHGWTTVLDVVLNGHRPYWEILEPILPYTDIFMPNEHEGEKITDYRDPYDQAKMFLDAGAGTVLITQGEGGTLCFGVEEQFRAGIYPTNYVSGSGAGDAFCAGLIAALLEGINFRDALCWGSAVGASSVRGVSTTGTVFNRKELLAFLDEHSLVFENI